MGGCYDGDDGRPRVTQQPVARPSSQDLIDTLMQRWARGHEGMGQEEQARASHTSKQAQARGVLRAGLRYRQRQADLGQAGTDWLSLAG